MLRRLVILIVLFVVVVAGLGIYKALSIRSQIAMFTAPKPPIHVGATSAEQLQWQTRLPAIGTLTSALGVELTAEVSGVVSEVLFESGQKVEAGQDLVRMGGAVEQASLATAEAQAELARLEFNRQQNLLQRQSISQSQYDQARSSLRQATARADELRATLEKKRIQAPFSGRIGISRVDPGDYLSPGANIATLQNLDRLYVDFFMPEQYYPQLAMGQTVRVKVAAFPGEVFEARVVAINPKVEATSRNLQIRASVANPDEKLLPGMFAELELVLPGESAQVVVPETAMTFTLYGNSVYVITPRRDEDGEVVTDESGEPVLEVQRRFVKTGQRRDGQVVVLEGLQPGEQVVISGQLKLDNGARVAIDNSNPL
ncbi:membrane fusion protein, multidrug efflux system [Halopseudomonas xinjiangensis]|uniref:Membrane fusion protein, multidrug efflux system n=1 Tax=Halopseudomonas xinjiangensis TaxID=487184 RepID=A0A1H1N1A1_9GAMM|nr:efflux RND transporter periplasmic adaptor subunit [Halopseudomonas xinjiangensis]SDR92465.1 membrane fusion protein, multidrug efflux system [Halopseudomonas xinjiangensis]